MATPYVTIARSVVTSTQDIAADELAAHGRPVLVVAQEQTEGRGRSGNDWWHAPRATAASLAFPASLLEVDETFSLAVGLAVRSAIADTLGIQSALKWPNDLEIRGDKVGGVLVERNEHRVVVGCGLNLYWPDRPAGVGALCESDPGSNLGEAIARSWADRLFETGGAWDRSAYLAACSTIGADVTWHPDGKGRVETVDDRGGLVVATGHGTTTLRSGEVRAVRSISGEAD